MKQYKVPGSSLVTLALIVALLATALPLGTLGSQALVDEPRTWHVDDDLADYPDADFTRIQDAVNAASSGDTIIVYPGTYTENVDVNNLTIKSESGAEATIVHAANSNDHVFEVTADYKWIYGEKSDIFYKEIYIKSNKGKIIIKAELGGR